MKITRRQLRHIVKEAIDPREMEEPLGGWAGDALTNDPDYPHPDDTDTLKVADLVRLVDYRGDGRGGDFERVVGDQIGTVVEVDKDIDGTQYTVFFPDGTTIMDTADSFEIVNENKITKRQLRRVIRESLEDDPEFAAEFMHDKEAMGEATDYPAGYEPTNVDKVYEIIQPLLDDWNIGSDRQGEIAMEIANLYDATVDNPDEIYAHAEEQIIAEQEEAEKDVEAAEEILATRMGSYQGRTLPGGKKIK